MNNPAAGPGDSTPVTPNAERETIDLPTLAKRLGIGRRQVYEAARRGDLPVPVIRVGRRLVVSRVAVSRLLGASDSETGGVA